MSGAAHADRTAKFQHAIKHLDCDFHLHTDDVRLHANATHPQCRACSVQSPHDSDVRFRTRTALKTWARSYAPSPMNEAGASSKMARHENQYSTFRLAPFSLADNAKPCRHALGPLHEPSTLPHSESVLHLDSHSQTHPRLPAPSPKRLRHRQRRMQMNESKD